MSVLIRGMETPMPGDMIVCAMIDGKTQCTLATRHRPVKWCEVVEVPTPHGDLIDADRLIVALKNSVYANSFFRTPTLTMSQIEQLIEHQPTVIEAEDKS